LIEAALIGQNIAPGFNRNFASENWSFIKPEMWDQAFEEAEDYAKYDQPLDISGSDIDHKAIQIASENAVEAGLGDLITWKQMQVRDLFLKQEGGYIIGNPPYGERLGDIQKITPIYQAVGKIIKENPSWSIYILTAFKDFEKQIGKKPTKRRKLFNGFIRTDYYQYFGKK
ncbi:MAG TPA: class I SAM-dependent RNA methyltransferase, partial [Bacillota bacterium]|nr:class I SAM-dependent RNA methyltransferase [Bacillota bacterium]